MSQAAPAVKDEPGSATDTASGLTASATRFVERLLEVGIDGRGPLDSAQSVADKARATGAIVVMGDPIGIIDATSADADSAIDLVVRRHMKLAAAGGFVTGVGGLFTLPVALPVNVAEFYLVATRMVAAVACLRGYDLRQPEVRSAVLLALVGADSDDLLQKAGLTTSDRLATLAAERMPGPALMMVNKAVGFRLLSQIGRKSLPRFGKAVPLVGGAVGAVVDTYLLVRVAAHARHEFPPTMALTATS